MSRIKQAILVDVAARSFWLLPALAMLAGGALGILMPELDQASDGDLGLFTTSDTGSARSLLETIAAVTISVAGISFSVTVVAIQLASQQLGPRVLRTFRTDWLNRGTLAIFLGVSVYALISLGRLGAPEDAPNLVLTVGVTGAVVAFGFFAAFIHNVVVSLQAETVIHRIGDDAAPLLASRYPSDIGEPAEGLTPEEFMEPMGDRVAVRAPRAGFFNAIDGETVLEAAREEDGRAVQVAALGDFVISGTTVIEVAAAGNAEALAERVGGTLDVGSERTLVQDVAFPVRQLVDIGLRALSPGVNDPTTAETAASELTDLLTRIARTDGPALVRLASDGEPRFLARPPSLDELVGLGFRQLCDAASEHLVVRERLVELLDRIAEAAPPDERLPELERLRGGLDGSDSNR